MVEAYILDRIENDVAYWKYSNNPIKIIEPPINDVVFIDETDDKHHNLALEQIESKYNIDQNHKKYPGIFNSNTDCRANHQITIDLKSCKRDFVRYQNKEFITSLADYIKDTHQTLEIEPVFNQKSVPYHHKDDLNNLGIYIRSTKMTIEYAPELAAKQQKNRHRAKPTQHYGLRANELSNLSNIFHRIFIHNMNISIRYDRQIHYPLRKKFEYAKDIIFMIGLFNIFFKKNSYRKLDIFQLVKEEWLKTPEKKYAGYPVKFVEFMANEIKIPAPKKINKEFTPEFKLKKNATIRL